MTIQSNILSHLIFYIISNHLNSKLLAHCEAFPNTTRPDLRKGLTSMHDTMLSSLTLRIDEPYWLLHQGNCQHFIVLDQIRLMRASDGNPASYPRTVLMTPVTIPLCRACTKVPATFSIQGDIRLGESPCVLCGPCWKSMGDPSSERVLVVPLPKHELGW